MYCQHRVSSESKFFINDLPMTFYTRCTHSLVSMAALGPVALAGTEWRILAGGGKAQARCTYLLPTPFSLCICDQAGTLRLKQDQEERTTAALHPTGAVSRASDTLFMTAFFYQQHKKWRQELLSMYPCFKGKTEMYNTVKMLNNNLFRRLWVATPVLWLAWASFEVLLD